MTFVVSGAPQGYGPELDNFTKLPTEVGILDWYWKEIKPSGTLSPYSQLDFNFTNDSPDFIDVSKIKFALEYQILNDKGLPMANDEKCGPVNNMIASFFRQFDFFLDQKNLTASVGVNYPYLAIFHILLTKGIQYRTSLAATGGFVKDTPEYMDDATCANNLGLHQRRGLTLNKKTAQLVSPLFTDFAFQDRLLVNAVSVNARWQPATDKFRLMWETPTGSQEDFSDEFEAALPTKKKPEYYKLDFITASLFVPFARIHPGYLMQMSEKLKKEPIDYEITRTDIKAFTVASGNFEFVVENIFNDMIPKKCYIAMVTGKAYSGDNESNCFNFQHFHVIELTYQVNGQIVGIPLRMDFDADHFYLAYTALFETISPYQKELPDLDLEGFKDGCTIFGIDNEKTKQENVKNPLMKGSSRLSLRFGKALKESIVVLCYGIFDTLVTVDEPRNVILHHG